MLEDGNLIARSSDLQKTDPEIIVTEMPPAGRHVDVGKEFEIVYKKISVQADAATLTKSPMTMRFEPSRIFSSERCSICSIGTGYSLRSGEGVQARGPR